MPDLVKVMYYKPSFNAAVLTLLAGNLVASCIDDAVLFVASESANESLAAMRDDVDETSRYLKQAAIDIHDVKRRYAP